MTYNDVKELLRQVRYKPGWTFTITTGVDIQPAVVRVRFEAPNCENPTEIISLGMPRRLEYEGMGREDFIVWLIETVRRCEDHEMREWLRINQKKVDDPHANPEALERLYL